MKNDNVYGRLFDRSLTHFLSVLQGIVDSGITLTLNIINLPAFGPNGITENDITSRNEKIGGAPNSPNPSRHVTLSDAEHR